MREPVEASAAADLALAVYLEPLAEDRHVLLLGDANGVLSERLDAVALRLDIIDPAAREPSRGPVPELPFHDASFDVVLVSDVSALPEPRGDAVRELRRVLADDGVLVACVPADGRKRRRGPQGDEALEKLLGEELRYVRVLGQASVAGQSLSLRDGAGDEFAIDTSLVRDAADVERFVAVASDVRVKLEPKLWVQVPREQGESGVSHEALHRLEDQAREAARREADAVRALESERKARSEAEQRAEKARSFERRLRDAEADYDDAVARLRYLESELAERESALLGEQKRREAAEEELAREKTEVLSASQRVKSAEAARDAAKADAEAHLAELSEVEKRLAERAEQVRELEREKREKEVLARDLVEELRRLEQHKTADVEHDARVAELEAERDRAVSRALEAEVAREAAQMRIDELRAQWVDPAAPPRDAELEGAVLGLRRRVAELEQRLQEAEAPATEPPPAPPPFVETASALPPFVETASALPPFVETASALPPFVETASALPPPMEAAELLMLRGRTLGLELRVAEAERALADAQMRALRAETTPAEVLVDRAIEHASRGERTGLALRLRETEAALATFRAQSEELRKQAVERTRLETELERERSRAGDALAVERVRFDDARASHDLAIQRLEQRIAELERKNADLARELEEADRFAEVHAEDAQRIEALEFELEASRRRADAAEDDLRATEAALRTARADLENAALEASARVELAQRRESEARQERDSTRAALEEARSTLAQLAGNSLPE